MDRESYRKGFDDGQNEAENRMVSPRVFAEIQNNVESLKNDNKELKAAALTYLLSVYHVEKNNSYSKSKSWAPFPEFDKWAEGLILYDLLKEPK